MAAPVCVPPSSARGSPFCTSSPALVICAFIDDNHSDGCEVVSHCGFNLLSLMISDVEHLFMSIVHLSVLFGKCLFRSSAHFLVKLCSIFGYQGAELLILDNLYLIQYDENLSESDSRFCPPSFSKIFSVRFESPTFSPGVYVRNANETLLTGL